MQAFPLSPRSVNIRAKPRHDIKKESEPMYSAAARKIQKEKDHAGPPPYLVVQSEGSDGIPKETFETGHLLGKGGFAICYQARLVGLKYKKIPEESRVFALKIVKANFAQKRMQDKFRTELQIHSKMRHPNIVEFHRAFTFDNCTYVVLELCANGSVADMVRKRRCLSLPEVRRFTIQLCGAIKYMHARNVIHRDLKMGNIFIDRDMNLKIGDFGLAAVLVSESDIKGFSNRRTTLCGTPNYIAPEILAKSKKGHDHKVDIWAVGVIVYAMLTGVPPFQAGSPDDIYKKVKCSTYSWPGDNQVGNDVSRTEARKDGKPYNDIPHEAKDLVASLLLIKADDRPDPDQIVVHPFFSMHKGKAIPKSLTQACTLMKPSWLLPNTPQGDVVDQTFEHLAPKALARECGVGHFPGDSQPVDIAGEDLAIPLYQECLVEEAEGRGPAVPLPQDVVYTSRSISKKWPSPENASGGSQHQRVNRSSHNQQVAAPMTRRIQSYSRSHAADIRSQAGLGSSRTLGRAASGPSLEGYPTSRRVVTVNEANMAPKKVSSDTQASIRQSPLRHVSAPSQSVRQTSLNDLPLRSIHGTVPGADFQSQTLPRHMSRTMDRASLKLTSIGKGSLPRSMSTQLLKAGETSNAVNLLLDEKPSLPRMQSKVNIVAHVQEDLIGDSKGTHSSPQDPLPAQPRRVSPRSVHPTHDIQYSPSLFGPDEVVEIVPNTRPRQVLRRLRLFNANLDAGLKIDEDVSAARISSHPIDDTSSLTARDLDERPVVVQWVDYTNKFGIGYILRNGTVGCVFKADHGIQPSCVVVPGAETHLRKRKMTDYYDRNQIVPKHGSPVEFLENCGDEGIKRITKPANAFQVEVNAEGISERWASNDDMHDFEKRRKLCLWDKFGKYMTQTLGKDDCRNQDSEETDSKTKTRRKCTNNPGPFIKFYQRLGNVGIWGFGNGSFQFNFPDHTKLVISEDGTWIDFYHLPIEAAQALRKGDSLKAGALDERKVLSYAVSVMLCGHHGADTFGQVIKANELRQKLEFVRDIIKTWIDNGGLGCMTPGTQRLTWTGLAERGGSNKKQKLVWVTVGAKGGDERFEQIVEGVSDHRS